MILFLVCRYDGKPYWNGFGGVPTSAKLVDFQPITFGCNFPPIDKQSLY